MKLLDTCFLIDLQRERVRGNYGPTRRFLEAATGEEFAVSVVAAVEFLEGYKQADSGERFLSVFRMVPITMEVARIAGRIRRSLRQQGQLIGDFDILIAATAMEMSMTLVTDNVRHFQKVAGLEVVNYL